MPSIYLYGRQVGIGPVLSAYVGVKSGQIVINRGATSAQVGATSAQVGANRDKSLLRRDKSGESRREVRAKFWLVGVTSGLSRRGDKSGTFQRRPPRL